MNDPRRLAEGPAFDLPPYELRFATLSEPWRPSRGFSEANQQLKYSVVVAMGLLNAQELNKQALRWLKDIGLHDHYKDGCYLPARDRSGHNRFSENEWGVAATSTVKPGIEFPVLVENPAQRLEMALKLGHYPLVVLTVRWFAYKVSSSLKGVAAELIKIRLVDPIMPAQPVSDAEPDLIERLKSAARDSLLDEAAKEIRELRDNLRNAKIALWCVIMAAGGEVKVPLDVVQRVTLKSALTQHTDWLHVIYSASDGTD